VPRLRTGAWLGQQLVEAVVEAHEAGRRRLPGVRSVPRHGVEHRVEGGCRRRSDGGDPVEDLRRGDLCRPRPEVELRPLHELLNLSGLALQSLEQRREVLLAARAVACGLHEVVEAAQVVLRPVDLEPGK